MTEARPDHADARVRSTSRFPRPAVGRLIAWQVLLLCVVISLAEHDGVRWVATATASLIFLLTLVRVRFRWLYQWVPTIVRFLHGRRSGGLGRLLAGLTFATTSEGRGTPAVGVVHDGAAWMSMVAVESVDVLGTDPASLPLGRITELLDFDGSGPVTVQVLVRMIPGARQVSSPLTRRAWIVLRVEPATRRTSAFARGNTVTEVHKILSRGAQRAAELLDSAGMRCRMLDEDGIREAMAWCGPEPSGSGIAWAEHWSAVRGAAEHTTYWLRCWPDGGLGVLMTVLGALPVSYVTVSLTATARQGSAASLTVLVRTTCQPGGPARGVVERAALSGGAQLMCLHGEQSAGVLATLPLGRGGVAGRLRSPVPSTVSLAPAGLPVGSLSDGTAVLAQLLRAKPTHVGLFGSAYVAKLLALRAVTAGVPVHVITSRAGQWAPLMEAVNRDAPRMNLYPPGDPGPAANGSGSPLLVVDDTDDVAGPGLRRNIGAWQAVIVVRAQVGAESARLLTSYDAVILQRVTDGTDAALASILPEAAMRWMPRIPPEIVAVYTSGETSFVNLSVTQQESSLLGAPRLEDTEPADHAVTS